MIKVLELHHHGIRIGITPEEVESGRRFYTEVLGLRADPERPNLPGVPGFWMFVGNEEQSRLDSFNGRNGSIASGAHREGRSHATPCCAGSRRHSGSEAGAGKEGNLVLANSGPGR